MLFKWLLFSLCIMPAMFSNTKRKCPTECQCSMDDLDRYQAICTKGKWRNKCKRRNRYGCGKGGKTPLNARKLCKNEGSEVVLSTDKVFSAGYYHNYTSSSDAKIPFSHAICGCGGFPRTLLLKLAIYFP